MLDFRHSSAALLSPLLSQALAYPFLLKRALPQLKNACKSFLLELGYEIHPVNKPIAEHIDLKAAGMVKESRSHGTGGHVEGATEGIKCR